MHYLLVGPGALGCLLSSVITKGIDSRGGEDQLTILDYNADRAEYLSSNGIEYHLADRMFPVPVKALSDPGLLAPVDVVLLCVKSYDVISSLEFCAPILNENSLLIFLQNGISHLDLPSGLHKATAAFGTTTEGATLLGKGKVRHGGSGITYLGFLETVGEQANHLLEKTRELFAAGGLQVHLTEDILSRLWAKLFINVAINALTATLGCKNGELLNLPGIDKRMETAVTETIAVARAKNISIVDPPYPAALSVCQKTAANVSSMLQDVRNKRRTEIDAINGAVVRLAQSLEIETPENTLLCRQIKDLEESYV